jgi:hypothetical protein
MGRFVLMTTGWLEFGGLTGEIFGTAEPEAMKLQSPIKSDSG